MLIFLLLFVTQITLARPVANLDPRSAEEAAVLARLLLKKENVGFLNIVEKSGIHEGNPASFMEYIADCSEDGDPTLLGIKISSGYQNWHLGSPVSLSVSDSTSSFALNNNGNNINNREVTDYSSAALPRMVMFGNLTAISDENKISKIASCFFLKHPDAISWAPGQKDSPHESEWLQFTVDSIYWIGGFGNVAYIGEIPMDIYRNGLHHNNNNNNNNNNKDHIFKTKPSCHYNSYMSFLSQGLESFSRKLVWNSFFNIIYGTKTSESNYAIDDAEYKAVMSEYVKVYETPLPVLEKDQNNKKEMQTESSDEEKLKDSHAMQRLNKLKPGHNTDNTRKVYPTRRNRKF